MADMKTGIFAKNVQKRLNRAQEKLRTRQVTKMHDHFHDLPKSQAALGLLQPRSNHRGKLHGMDIHDGGKGSKSQNCLWNTIIGGLTGNLKEKPKPTIISDPRPPEEILADELPPVDSPEALVKTSFRSDRYEFTLFSPERVSF